MKTKAYQEPLGSRTLSFIRENRLIQGDTTLLVAVSGGPDSICLLHLLYELRGEVGVNLHIAHLDHQLRGDESLADAAYVKALAERLGLPVTIGSRDVREYRARGRLSLEEAAREVRYDFLAQTAESIGSSSVAVGHTMDDNVETILMHIIRGTGIRGLQGLLPSTTLRTGEHSIEIIRPLLEVSRCETADYCRSRNLEPRSDSTNSSLSHLRNRIRLQLIPLLTKYNPRIGEALLRTARLAKDDLASLDKASSGLASNVFYKENDCICFDKKAFLALPVSLQRHLIRQAGEEILGSLKDIESNHVSRLVSAASKPAGKKIELPTGLNLVTEYSRFLLFKGNISPQSIIIDAEIVLAVPGNTVIPGWQVNATVQTAGKPVQIDSGRYVAYLNLDAIGNTLSVRTRRPGDRFQPLGMAQTKELAEFMIDARIPRDLRDSIPVVCSPSQIVWVVGHRIDDRVKAAPVTGRILRLEFKRT